MSESLLVIVVALCFLAVSKTILVTSGKIPPPKPLSKKNRITLYIVVFFFLLCQIVAVYLGLYADGLLDFDFL